MFFFQQALNEMSEARKAIGGKYESLLMKYVALPLKDAIAREYATQGFPRRLGVMAHCIQNVFTTLPPEKEEIRSKTQLFDATVNIQAFLVNAFGCIDNLARIWVHEKPLRTRKGKALPNGQIGLDVHHTLVRTSLSQPFQDYLKTLDEWLTFMGNFRHALAHRIPLYIPPYAIRQQDEAAYKEFEQNDGGFQERRACRAWPIGSRAAKARAVYSLDVSLLRREGQARGVPSAASFGFQHHRRTGAQDARRAKSIVLC
jgi:hypothetical protein